MESCLELIRTALREDAVDNDVTSALFPDEDLSGTVSGSVVVKACSTITVADDITTYTIEGPNGDATLHAGTIIVIDNGFEVEQDASFTVITDPL